LIAGVAAGLAVANAAAQPLPAPAGLSPTGQPASFAIRGETYAVAGYKSARWGMTPDEVRAVVPRDFPGVAAGATRTDPLNRTTVMAVKIDTLAPGPGPAVVSYVFGASSGKLMHVNVDWPIDKPTPADRSALLAGGTKATADFLGYYWKIGSVARGIPVGPQGLILFAGADEAGGAVEVRVLGIGYLAKTKAGDLTTPMPSGAALLHIAFAAAGQPDVYVIRPGDF
jgi:hypothetical protein